MKAAGKLFIRYRYKALHCLSRVLARDVKHPIPPPLPVFILSLSIIITRGREFGILSTPSFDKLHF